MRLAKLADGDLSSRQRQMVQRLQERRGGMRGPYTAWIHSPELCDKAEALAYYARFESSLSRRISELVLLIASRHWDSQYSWNAHFSQAVEAGVSQSALLDLAERRTPDFGERDEQVAYTFCREVLEEHFVSDETFAAARELFGSQGVVDLIGALGSFSMLGMCLNTFEVDLQPDRQPPFSGIEGYPKIESLGSRV